MPSFYRCFQKLATILLLSGLSLFSAVAQKNSDSETLIIGGQTVPISQVPWQVALKSTQSTGTGSDHIGGGSIIAPAWVLTSASALVNETAATLRIRAGSADQTTGGQLVQVSQIIRHPSYNPATLDNDIALVQLASPLTFNANVQAIAYATSSNLPATALQPGNSAQLTGWGATTAGSYAITTQLNRVTMALITNQDANQRNAVNPPFPGPSIPPVTANMFAVYEAGKGTGSFDGGGPVVVFPQGVPVLAGCSSWSRTPQDQYPSICTRVQNYQQWISSYLPGPLTVSMDARVTPQLDDAYAVTFTATVTGGSGTYSYAWEVDRNNGLGYQPINNNASTYRVTIMTGQSICVRVTASTSTQTGNSIACATPDGGGPLSRSAAPESAPAKAESEALTSAAYPNPASAYLDVRLLYPQPVGKGAAQPPLAAPARLSLYNAQGGLVYAATTSDEHHRVDTSQLPTGIYYLRLTQNDKVTTERVVIER